MSEADLCVDHVTFYKLMLSWKTKIRGYWMI